MKYRNRSWYSELMSLWHRAVLVRAGCRCEICGSVECIEAHHVISRRFIHTCFKAANGVAVCRKCHSNPGRILAWLEHMEDYRYAWFLAQKRIVHISAPYDPKPDRKLLEAA